MEAERTATTFPGLFPADQRQAIGHAFTAAIRQHGARTPSEVLVAVRFMLLGRVVRTCTGEAEKQAVRAVLAALKQDRKRALDCAAEMLRSVGRAAA